MRGNAIDKTITMNRDFFIDTINFAKTNLDSIIMMVIIIFLIIGWTWVFDWKMPKKKKEIFKKNIAIEVSEWVKRGEKGPLVDKYGNKLDRFGNKIKWSANKLSGGVFESFQSKGDDLLNNEFMKKCGDDKLCLNHNNCLLSQDCGSDKNCCEIKKKDGIICVGGGKDGPLYNKDNFDEWWYLGNNYKKN